jgi:uncharacterized protein (TIGR02145 family)
MNQKLNISLSIILSLFFVVIYSCKKAEETTATNPVVVTNSASLIGQNWATLNGSINANGNIVKVAFQYDSTTAYSHIAISDPDTVTGTTNTSVGSALVKLKAGTTYYFRVFAIVSSDTIFGDEESFITTNPGKSIIGFNSGLAYGSISDIDNNVYKTVVIGTQTWIAENLRTSRFNDGTNISFTPDASDWSELSSPGYSWYNNDSVIYGALYNWYAVTERNLCPTGWHVPSDADWTILTNYVGGETTAADKLKEAGTTHWLSTLAEITNEKGFTALPGGYRFAEGTYGNIRKYGFWWSSTESSTAAAFCVDILSGFSNTVRTTSLKNSGFSVRCVKD